MEEEIDLRPYIKTLIAYWRWIIGGAVATALAAVLLLSLRQPVYETTTLVVVTQPNLLFRFEPRIETVSPSQQFYNAFPEIAMSDHILLELVERTGAVDSLDDMRGLVETRVGQDPSLIYLAVRHKRPELAAEIANEWATLFAERANQLYGTKNQETVTFLEEQLARAEAEREAAEQELIRFQEENRVALLDNQLNAALEDQKALLTEQRSLAHLAQNVTGLREQLASHSGDRPATLGDQLTAISLQVQTYNAHSSLPVQLQMESAELLAGKSTAEQIAFLDDLTVTISEKQAEAERKLAELEPGILTMQRELQEAKTREARLLLDQEVAQETYMTLVRKVDEARISAQDTNQQFKVASKAAVPEKPVSSGRLLSAVVAGMLGLILAAMGAFVHDWWRRENLAESDSEPSADRDVAVIPS